MAIELEFRNVPSAGKQIFANFNEEKGFNCGEFTMKGSAPQPVLIGFEPWIQFPNPRWEKLTEEVYQEMVDLYNAKHSGGDMEDPGYSMEKELEGISTYMEWCKDRDEYDIGEPLTDKEIELAVNHLKELAKTNRVFCDRARPRLYRWLKMNMENCYIDINNQNGGIIYFTIGTDQETVEDYMDTI